MRWQRAGVSGKDLRPHILLGVSEEYWAIISEVLQAATPTGAWALGILTMTCGLSGRPQPPRVVLEAVAGCHTLAEAAAALKNIADYADMEISVSKLWEIQRVSDAVRSPVDEN